MSVVSNIFELPSKKRTAIWNKLAEAGMTPERALGLLDAPELEVRRWVETSPGLLSVVPGMIYDAKRIGSLLGVDTPDSPAPLPQRADERIIYLPPSITSPTDLRRTKAPMWDQDWYDSRGYTARPGYWGVVLPVPDSNEKTDQEQNFQIQYQFSGYQRTPMLVDFLLLCCETLATGVDLLDGQCVRCPEQTADGHCVELFRFDRRLRFDYYWHGRRTRNVWSSAARWISS